LIEACPNIPSQTALIARNNTGWHPPLKDFLKLNVDVHLHDDERWGFGMILRREDGRAVGAATKVLKGSADATLAEAIGVGEALNWIKTLNHQHIIIETDAAKVVNALEKKSFPRKIWGNVTRKISRDLDSCPLISVRWVNRKGNQVAHELARLAISEPNKFWPNNFPTCILSYILYDMEGVNCNI
jgi:ribonuclease HI